MRVSELFEEGPIDDLIADLSMLLITAKTKGLTTVSTDSVVRALNTQGHAVTSAGLLSVLKNNPLVSNASEKFIDISGEENNNSSSSEKEDNEDKVSQIAQKAAKKDM